MRHIVTCALLALALPAAARAQEEPLEPAEQSPPPYAAPDLLAQARAASARGDAAEALSRYLRMLAQEPDNVAALTGAGRAALDIGDPGAAAGFFARAEDKAPRDGAVKAGLGATMTQNGNGRAALRFFREAVALGVPLTAIAADRGLAYDLVGQPRRAQADYMLALRTQPSDELIRRLALSQAIAGDRVAALATLDPLLRRQDVPAWRARAFVYALTGDLQGAEQDALAVMPRDQAEAIRPYLARLGSLKASEKAAAVDLGRFPSAPASAATQSAMRTAQLAPLSRPAIGMVQAMPATGAVPASGFPPSSSSTSSLPDRALAASPSRSSLRGGQTATRGGRSAGAVPPASSPVLPFDRTVSADAGGVVRRSEPDQADTAPPTAPPSKAERAAEARAAARERAAEKAKADAAAKAKQKKEEEAEARLAAKRDPARIWVQVAGGANKADLPKAWAQLKAKWSSQLAGKSPWTTHYRFTNRLLIGPFPSEDAAQDWVTERKKEGFGTFRVETAAGTPVERLPAK